MIRRPITSDEYSVISVHILRMPKTKTSSGYRYCYNAIVPVNTAKQLNLCHKEGILLRTMEGCMFPTVIIIRRRKNRKNSYIYSFTVPKNLVKDFKKNIKFNIISRSNIKEKCIQNKNTSTIKLKKILPSKTMKDSEIYKFDLDKNKLLIWIYNRAHTKYFIFPQIIPVEVNNLNFFELMGFLFSEGYKYRKNGNYSLDALSFSNENVNQIEWSIKVFEQLFRIKKSERKVKIIHPQARQKEQYLKNFWSKKGFLQKNIKIYQGNKIKAPYGACEPYINSIVLGEVFYELINYAKILVLKNKQNAISFFRGLSRGDMGVSSTKRLQIVFTNKGENDVLFFRKLCNKIGLTTGKPYFYEKKDYWSSCITGGYNSFKKIKDFDGITHDKRKERLLSGLTIFYSKR